MRFRGNQSNHKHCDPRKQGADLIEIELARGYPELRIDRFGHDEIERSLPNVLRNLHDRHKDHGSHRGHDEDAGGEDKGVGAAPTGYRVCVSVDHQENQKEEENPDGVLENLSEEIGTKLQLSCE